MRQPLKVNEIGMKGLVFFFATIPRVILCFFMFPIGVLSDEAATISGGAYLAGYDWSNVIQNAGYYGTGFTVLTAPLFLLTDNPFVIYNGIGILCAVLQGISSLIAYKIFTGYFGIQNRLSTALVSIAASYLVTDCSTIIFNEHPLMLCSWLLAWILLVLQKNIEDRKKKAVGTLLLVLVLGYSLTLHTRALSFWLAAGIAVLFYAWVYRKCLVSIPVACLAGGAAYLGGKFYVSFMQGQLWKVGESTGVRNAEINLQGGVLQLLDPQNWQAWANIVLGQIHTIGVFTGGLFLLFLIVFVHLFWKALIKRREFMTESTGSVEKAAFPVVVFCMAGIAMTILGQSLSWLPGSREVINTGFENNLYSTKAYGYLRYFGPFCGPLFLMCCVYLYRCREKVLGYFKPALAALLICEAYWQICIVPYLYRCNEIGAFNFYFPFSLWTLDKETRYLALVPASVVLFVSFFLCWKMLQKRKQWISIALIGCMFIEVYFFIGIAWDREFMKGNYEMADASYEFIESIKDEVELPDTFYVQDARDWVTDHYTYYEYQFLFNRITILPEIPEDSVEEAILFTNMVYTEDQYKMWTEQGYKYLVLDEDELLLVKGKELQEELQETGVVLKK